MSSGTAPRRSRERARNLAEIARLNGVFGGRLVTLRHVRRLAARLPAGRPVTVLDLGTGSADVPRALVRWARRARRPLRVFALDRDPATLAVARATVEGYPEIVRAPGRRGGAALRNRAVDVAISALTLHHLEPAAAIAYLRPWTGWRERASSSTTSPAADTAGPGLARHAGAGVRPDVASRWPAVRPKRAYTPDEVRALCRRAGVGDVEVARYRPLLRFCLVLGRSTFGEVQPKASRVDMEIVPERSEA